MYTNHRTCINFLQGTLLTLMDYSLETLLWYTKTVKVRIMYAAILNL